MGLPISYILPVHPEATNIQNIQLVVTEAVYVV